MNLNYLTITKLNRYNEINTNDGFELIKFDSCILGGYLSNLNRGNVEIVNATIDFESYTYNLLNKRVSSDFLYSDYNDNNKYRIKIHKDSIQRQSFIYDSYYILYLDKNKAHERVKCSTIELVDIHLTIEDHLNNKLFNRG